MLAPKTAWKLTNHHKTYLSVQCDILCNCCSSVPITYQCLTTLVVHYLFCVGLALKCFAWEKPQRSIWGPPAHGIRPSPFPQFW